MPAHRIGIWLGAYGPRMLRVAGRLADGWLPSLGFGRLTEDELAARHEEIDAAARAAGRVPEDIRRALNVTLEPDRSTCSTPCCAWLTSASRPSSSSRRAIR